MHPQPTPTSDIAISVIVPVYNEQENLPLLHERLTATLRQLADTYEILFVNDGSRDASLLGIMALAQADPHVRYLDFSRNFGHQIAVTAGLDAARGQAIAIIDADLQDPPELIAEMYAKYQEGYEVVYAKRRRRSGESFLKRVTAKVFYRLLARMTQLDIPLDAGDFRIIDHRVAEVLRNMPEQNKYIRGQIAWAGYRQTYVEYDRQSRHAGETGYTWRKMIRFALDGLTAFSDSPLKIATFSGFIVSAAAFLLMIYALMARLIWKDYVEGWASLILSVLFIGGIQLLSLGVIGEYVNRIASNVRNRPLYVIREEGGGGKGEEIES